MLKEETFENWMKKVNVCISNICGLTANDLPDVCYRDFYDDELTPHEAAQEALAEAGFDDGSTD